MVIVKYRLIYNQKCRTRSKNLHALAVLKSNKIWCSKPVRFNDPFDGSIPFIMDDSPGAFVKAAVTVYAKDGHNWDNIKKILDENILLDCTLNTNARKKIKKTAKEFSDSNKTVGILSLTEEPLSILMWSHYGAGHKGVCVGFERNPANDLGDDDACRPVRYAYDYPEPLMSQIFTADGSLTRDLFYTKARNWAYEKEWRLMTEKGNKLVNCPGKITKVILGCRAKSKTEANFLTECRGKKIPLYRAKQVPGAFMLELAPLFTL